MTNTAMAPFSPIRVEDHTQEWPYPRITEARNAHEPVWFEVSEEFADQMLGAVPPRYFEHGFFCGEEADDEAGVPVHCAVVTVGERYFAREFPVNQREKLVSELLRSLPA